jgi:hypothetical protein
MEHTVRTLIRFIVLGLAAYGTRALYERLGPRKDELRESGTQFLERASSAAREVRSKVSDATHAVVETAHDQADEIKLTASEQADVVRSAADEFASSAKATQQLS